MTHITGGIKCKSNCARAKRKGNWRKVGGPMHVKLRKVGGSLMFAMPPEVIREFSLSANQQISARAAKGRTILEPTKRSVRRRTYAELLALCDLNAPVSAAERALIDMPSVGSEVIE